MIVFRELKRCQIRSSLKFFKKQKKGAQELAELRSRRENFTRRVLSDPRRGDYRMIFHGLMVAGILPIPLKSNFSVGDIENDFSKHTILHIQFATFFKIYKTFALLQRSEYKKFSKFP